MKHSGELRDVLTAALGSVYQIGGELEPTAMARVFAGRNLSENRDVIIKVLAPELVTGIPLERFTRELRVAASLTEPHIAPIQAAGITPTGLPWYVMPYMRGESLRARMSRGRVSLAESIGILRDVARALAHAHRQGVIHRDLKPENVQLSFGSAVVAEFGVMKGLAAARARTSGGELLASVGVSLGTPAYMAPEQSAGVQVDARSDLYAWGVIAYELLSGEHPFPGRTSEQLLSAQRLETPVHMALKLSEAPLALSELVMRCLEKDPARRPVAAAELVRVLEDTNLMASDEIDAAAAAPGTTFRRFAGAFVLATIVAAFTLGMPYVLERVHGARKASLFVTNLVPLTTLAVIPFSAGSGSADDRSIAQGMSDELALTLSRVPDARITGRMSAARFAGHAINELEIAKALDVGAVLTGSVRRDSSRIRASVRLQNANDGRVLWANTYDRPVADQFQVQYDIARHVIEYIAPALAGGAAASLAERRGTASIDSYNLFMRGLSCLSLESSDSAAAAITYLRQAIATDSGFARAHAWLAIAYARLTPTSRPTADSLASLSLAEAARALSIDSTSAEGHLAMGRALRPRLSFSDAERHLTLAVAGLPGLALAHKWRGENLAQLGRVSEARGELTRALEQNPSSIDTREALVNTDLAMRHFDQVIAGSTRNLAADSTLGPARVHLAIALTFSGRADSAATITERMVKNRMRTPGLRAAQMLAYAAQRRWTDATHVRESVQDDRTRSDYDLLASFVIFGQPRQALDVLDKIATRTTDLGATSVSIPCDPMFDPLRSDPQFVRFAAAHAMSLCPAPTAWPVAPRGARAN